MNNTTRSKIFYGVTAFSLIFALSACSPVAENETATADKDVTTKNLDETPKTDILVKDENATLSTDTVTQSDTELPKYLPADFPLPKDVEIVTSHSEQSEGKKSALLIIRTKEDMETIISRYKSYFQSRKLEEAAETIDDKNIIIEGESPTNSEYWSMIGGKLTNSEGVIELTISWTQL